jgi:hypothetical protein
VEETIIYEVVERHWYFLVDTAGLYLYSQLSILME